MDRAPVAAICRRFWRFDGGGRLGSALTVEKRVPQTICYVLFTNFD